MNRTPQHNIKIRTSPSEIAEFKSNLMSVLHHKQGKRLPEHLAIQMAARLTWPERRSQANLFRDADQLTGGSFLYKGASPLLTRPYSKRPPPFIAPMTLASQTSSLANDVSSSRSKSYVLESDGKRSKDDSVLLGSGTGGAALVTTDDQLNKILRSVRGYQGTFAIDQVNNIKVSPFSNTSFIVNSDPSTESGQHWAAVWISPVVSKSVEIFDSLAELSPLQGDKLNTLVEDIRKKVSELKLPYNLKLYRNAERDQRANSSTCGWFSARFILERARGMTFKQASSFKNITEAEKSLETLEDKYL